MGRPLTALGDRTFGSLRRHRNYRLYFVGNGISFIGTWMQQIAAYWLVLELTDSPLAVGALALAQTLPVTALALSAARSSTASTSGAWCIVTESVLIVAGRHARRPRADGHVAVWQVYVIGDLPGHRRRARHPRPAHARLPDRRPDDLTNAVALSSASARRRASSAPPSAASSSHRRPRRRVRRSTR